ncbi:hypothetical protein ABT025_31955 [Streptomyces sp. NPDC002809]|uniref:hypothetical protein n=1 Tax=Streptomyces sp. NPDC002809 TaxID=3154433 RepID=UPI0033235441
MDSDLRRAAVAALGELGRSEDWRDRADAGHGLAGFAEMQEAVEPLLGLVLDSGDTFVTRRTAQGLLRRKDRAGLAIVASALAVANDNHADWIHTAASDVLSLFAEDLDEALRLCEELSGDTDDRVARGARRLYKGLAGGDPVLRPA